MVWLDFVFVFPGVEALLNLAENQPTWQTSTDYGGESSRAVDGGLSVMFAGGGCTRSGYGPVIWGVDLGGIGDIFYVEILNRDENPSKWLFGPLKLRRIAF